MPVTGWAAGTDPGVTRELVRYWTDEFDWRRQEARINQLPQFEAVVAGSRVHFLRFEAEGGGRNRPLVLTHGWPSSVLELAGLAQRLASPSKFGRPGAQSFEVVVPSLPGFAYSEQRPQVPAEPPTHELWHQLMTDVLDLGSFGAHGGDLGAGITSRLGKAHPESVVGIHLLAVAAPEKYETADLSGPERRYLAQVAKWTQDEGAYSHQQSTRPTTLSYGLSDSPVGLLAWVLEKYRAWSDCGGDVFTRFTADEILTQVSLYWFTNSIGTSFLPYYEFNPHAAPGGKVHVPTAVAVFPGDLSQPPEEWAARSCNLARYTVMPRGGHFAAHEEPDLLADDIRDFFAGLAWPGSHPGSGRGAPHKGPRV